MAESLHEKGSRNNGSCSKNENISNFECAVCLQTSVHPAELPCGHIFCYLCIKGIVNQGRRCAMCRQDIPDDYLDKPKLLKPFDLARTNKGLEDGYLWFYEGRNGWWQYDERTSQELEIAYQKGERCCELLIAGFLYIADFDVMLQYRRNDPYRRRKIKRDLATISAKGIAGLKTVKSQHLSMPDLMSSVVPDFQNLHILPRHHCNDSNSQSQSNNNSNQQLINTVQTEVRANNRNVSHTSTPIMNVEPEVEYSNTARSSELGNHRADTSNLEHLGQIESQYRLGSVKKYS